MTSIVKPEVKTLAYTKLADPREFDGMMERDMEATDAESLLEFAGRSCYQSFHKPNPATRSCKDYLANIIKQAHGSVLEHATASFYITGVSRSFTHELVRHRHLSFSQLSQRFVDESDTGFVVPPALRELDAVFSPIRFYETMTTKETLQWLAEGCTLNYSWFVEALEDEGLTRKQAREAARAVLPNMVETRIVVSGNLRAWREYLLRRLDPSADAEIREVSVLILEELMKVAPAVFQDVEDWYNSLGGK
ncbi:FAD-dependent thymidylate synthase [Corynebacterium sp. NML120713]|uniref:FAD-dependent thymidylate synthase n=1 Tax=Corynebacterium sp. NML120713 TaxID=1906332 RepID=UPI0008FB0BD3|nr:FAD-dependent thymidylate synthase [Corynebacterium sp. NML120713]OIR43165.1 thymidylate synthase, flavin-dependent [Corynebacterium sp. NML120713]